MKLNGMWDFAFLPDYPKSVAEIKYDDEQLVPGCFDMDMRYRFARGIGCYHTIVDCGGFTKLIVGAVGLRGKVFFDGILLGEIETAYMDATFRFDAGTQGRHDLVILTDNTFQEAPSANFYEWYDIYGYGGIYRCVEIFPETPYWFEHLVITTSDIATGTVRVRAVMGGAFPEALPCNIDVDGKTLLTCNIAGGKLDTELQVPEFRLWSPDTPVLYRMKLSARDATKESNFGIRTISTKDGRLCLNGSPFKLMGYNRHDAHPDFGTAVPRETLLRDLRMIRDQGANFIRGCHYPQSDDLLDLCDKLGIMIWDESLGWGDHEETISDPEFCRKTLEQTKRMVRRSINHPCIAIWGFLNELHSAFECARPIVRDLVNLIHSEDDSRPVSYASNARQFDVCQDLIDVITLNIYPGWYYNNSQPYFCENDLTSYFNFILDHVNKKYPGKAVMIGEIGASASPGGYDGLRWSEEYQAEMDTAAVKIAWFDQRISGISIWQFCDNRTNNISGPQGVFHGFNNKGVVDAYRRPKYAWYSLSRFYAEIGLAKWVDPRLPHHIAN